MSKQQPVAGHRRRLRSIVAFVAIMATSGAVAACGDDDSGTTDASNAPDEVTIGATPALTGFLGPFDTEVLKGIRLRTSEINAEGGIDGKTRINLVVQDGASDPAQQRVAVQDILNDEQADFMIGSCEGAASTPGAIFAASNDVATVTTCSGDAEFPAKVGPFGFAGTSGAYAMGATMAQFAIDQGWERAYLVGSTTNVYSTQITKGIQDAYEDLGGTFTGNESVQLFEQSYADAVNKIRASGDDYDVIMTPLFVPDTVTFLQELRGAGIDAPVVLDDGADTPLLFESGDPGEVYVTTFGFPREGNNLEKFNDAYAAKHGNPPAGVQPGLGADLIDLIAAAVSEAGTTDSVALRDAFAELSDVDATTATINYAGSAYGAGLQERPLAILRVADSGEHFEFETSISVDPGIVPEPAG